jgi:hypothetical protein
MTIVWMVGGFFLAVIWVIFRRWPYLDSGQRLRVLIGVLWLLIGALGFFTGSALWEVAAITLLLALMLVEVSEQRSRMTRPEFSYEGRTPIIFLAYWLSVMAIFVMLFYLYYAVIHL